MYTKHNRSQTPEYKCWQQIKARCLNPNHIAYPDYGGRGITIDPTWAANFMVFFTHVGTRPTPKHSLDRLDNDRGYEPGNVRWATKLEQNQNRRQYGTGAAALGIRRATVDKTTNFKHGLISTPEYLAWSKLKDRCLNERGQDYPNYGGRGITVHPAWAHDFMAFYSHIGPRPSPSHSVDREDNTKGYEPGNVRWATKRQQNLNRRAMPKGPEHGNFDHGRTKSDEYRTWTGIKTRCFNTKHDGYVNYGARGITMCSHWRDDFSSFLADLGPKPGASHTVQRRDRLGHYSCGKCPECSEKGWQANCAWMPQSTQNRARSTGKLDMEKAALIRERAARGVPDKDIAAEFGITRSLVGKVRRFENWA